VLYERCINPPRVILACVAKSTMTSVTYTSIKKVWEHGVMAVHGWRRTIHVVDPFIGGASTRSHSCIKSSSFNSCVCAMRWTNHRSCPRSSKGDRDWIMAIITSVSPSYYHVAAGLPPHLPAHVTWNEKQLMRARVVAGENVSKHIQCSTVQHQPPGLCFLNNYGSRSSRFSRNCPGLMSFEELCHGTPPNVPDFFKS
jgi:hypothetical protein